MSLPRQPKAQLATLAKQPPAGDDWLHEAKLDGYRLLCRIDRGSVSLISRNGKDWTGKFPTVAEAAAALPCERALLDGEAVILDARGISSFQALQNAQGARRPDLFYFGFDLLHLDGRDLRREPLVDRKAVLAVLAEPSGVIRYSDHVVGQGAAFFAQACKAGLEGIISKRAASPYTAGRSRDWLKIKCLLRQELVIVGFTEPAGSRVGLGALLLGAYEDGALTYAGKVGTGFTGKTLRELRAMLEPLERTTPPVTNAPRGADARGVHWLRPALVAEIAFTEWTGDGVVRHASYQGLREDKNPHDITRER